jgi:hypothetical protein
MTGSISRAPARPDRGARGPASAGVGRAPVRSASEGTIRWGAVHLWPGSSSSRRLRDTPVAKPWGLDGGPTQQ